MQKHLLKFVCIICLFFAFSAPISYGFNEVPYKTVTDQSDYITKDIKVNDLDIEPINTQELKKEVVPDTKQEGKKVIGYFLKTMFGVMFCAVLLYLILLFVKKYYGSAFTDGQEEEFEAFDLSTPDTKQEALKSFLNRTK